MSVRSGDDGAESTTGANDYEHDTIYPEHYGTGDDIETELSFSHSFLSHGQPTNGSSGGSG